MWNLFIFIQSNDKENIVILFDEGNYMECQFSRDFFQEGAEEEKNLRERGSNGGAASKISYFLSRDLLVNR